MPPIVPRAARAALCASLISASMLSWVACRPHPVDAPDQAFTATSPNDGLSTIRARAETILATSTVTLTNSTREAVDYGVATDTGSLSYDIAADIGDLIDISYTDPEGEARLATLAVPLQAISIHGAPSTRYLAGTSETCLSFERDDLVDAEGDAEVSTYELVGPLEEELRGWIEDDGGALRLHGTPILFGVGACGLPLFEPSGLFPDGEGLPEIRHGHMAEYREPGGEGCVAFEATAQLPAPASEDTLEDHVIKTLLPIGPQAAALTDLPLGTCLVLVGSQRVAADPSALPCDLDLVQAEAFIEDSCEQLVVEGIVERRGGEGGCWRLKTEGGGPTGTFNLLGPLADHLPPEAQEGRPVKLSGYRTVGVEPSDCGIPLTVSGYSRPGGMGPPQGGPPVEGLR